MRTTVIKAVLVAMVWASAAGASESALKLESHYRGVADTLSKEFNEHGACGGEFEVYSSDIIGAAKKSREYFDIGQHQTKSKRKFSLSKSTLKAMKSTLALKEIMNMLDRNDPNTFEHALNRVIMWGPAPGAYGNMSYLEFGENNKVTVAHLELLNEEPWYQWNKVETSFFVSKRGQRLIVTVGKEEYLLKNYDQYNYGTWNLTPLNTPDANPWIKGFTDTPSECEA